MKVNKNECSELYLNLMKKSLTNWIYGDNEVLPYTPSTMYKKIIARLINDSTVQLMEYYPFDSEKRLLGQDWPPTAHTMIGIKRLDNIQFCVEEIIQNDIPGDLIETGVWRGGAAIFMRALLKVHQINNRKVWVADSFEGLPKPNEEKYPEDIGDTHYQYTELVVSLETVKENFNKYDLLDEQVGFLKGWFKDTLPTAPISNLSILRLDGDMYESTMDVLKNLYPKLSIGGYIIIDDYGVIKNCQTAVYDYRKKFGIEEPIKPIDGTGVYWQRQY